MQALNTAAVLAWRKRFRARLDLIATRYPPRIAIDLDDVADMLSVIADGGIILSKVVKDKDALSRQVMLYRDFVRSHLSRSLKRDAQPARRYSAASLTY